MTAIQQKSNPQLDAAGESSAPSLEANVFDGLFDFRERLLANNWPDASQLLGLLKSSDSADAQYVFSLMRSNGVLLGVWSTPRERFLYPDFQFNNDGQMISEVSLLLRILPAEGDDAGWRRAFWLYSPHALLDGCSPSLIFAADPRKILEVAKAEFNASSDEGW
ncbi:hypothetical protein [Paraburkholderia sp. C35]|uniref:hypothetical protein n=1 Tax=Paraburkholderia sp. C35 TaxID=2126993 RepID=UPI001EF46A74|nr:hypothetical protein [Paraburkholderia sp. C35]